jgi:hypothetical protein
VEKISRPRTRVKRAACQLSYCTGARRPNAADIIGEPAGGPSGSSFFGDSPCPHTQMTRLYPDSMSVFDGLVGLGATRLLAQTDGKPARLLFIL